MPNKIKKNLEKGNIKEDEWKDKNKLTFLINDCINIENNIKQIDLINETIKKCNSKTDLNIIFNPDEKEIEEFLNHIKNFGNINCNENAPKELFGKPKENTQNKTNYLFGNPKSIKSNNNLFSTTSKKKIMEIYLVKEKIIKLFIVIILLKILFIIILF